MRLLVFLAILTIGYGTLWYVDPVTADVKKGDAIFESITVGGVDIGKAVLAVGSIQQSILTEAQFQAQMSTDWVAMKGQAVAGSKICTEYSICTLPDATNLFLRSSDASSALALAKVDDTTAVNTLATSSSTVTGIAGTNSPSAVTGVTGTNVASTVTGVTGTNEGSLVTGGSISRDTASTAGGQTYSGNGTVQSDGPGSVYKDMYFESYTGGGATGWGIFSSSDRVSGTYPRDGASGYSVRASISHSHDISDVTGGTWSIGGTRNSAAQVWTYGASSGSAAAQVWTYGASSGEAAAQALDDGAATETAPDHMVVNTFIKIN